MSLSLVVPARSVSIAKTLRIASLPILLGFATAFAAGCAPARGANAPGHADAKSAALFARESDASLSPSPISVLEGAITGTVDASGTPKVKSEQNDAGELVSVVEFPIGTELPVSCTFRAGRLDAGMVMGELISHVATPEVLGGQPFAPEVSVAVADGKAGAPILTVVSPFYQDGAALLAKVSVAPSDDGSVICTHFEAGYKATFAKVVARVIGSLQFAKPSPQPRWHEVLRLEKGGAIAFEQRDVWDSQKAGHVVSRSIFATFTNVQGHWFGGDGMSEQTFEAKGGAVVEDSTKFAVAGKLYSDIKLTRKRPGTYGYEGKRGDESLSGTFTTKAPITSEMSRARQVKAWFGGRAPEARFVTYNDTENAKAATDLVFKRETADPSKVTIEVHGAKVTKSSCVVDKNGLCERSEDPSDGSIEARLFARGIP